VCDRAYANVTVKRDVPVTCILKGCRHFSRSVLVSVKGKTVLVFVQPGAKVNSSYYCDVVLSEGLVRDIRTKIF